MEECRMSNRRKGKVCIVVVGDIGRSPRMQYHATSFLKEGYDVEMIGYGDSKPIVELMNHTKMKFIHLWYCPEFKNFLPSILAYALKVIWQFITIFIALLMAKRPDFVFVQNPPSVPGLGICYMYSKLFRCKFIIDWHNYAYTIMGLSLGENHSLVKISKWIEFYVGRKSDGNLCVTKAMKEDLLVNHDIKAVVFYDRPPDFFKRSTNEEKHLLFRKLGGEYSVFVEGCKENETVFTRRMSDNTIELRKDRPALLVSSTSWTADEDISVLITALEEYENAKQDSASIPPLICAITGKGPLKKFYCKFIERRVWKFVKVITPWLEAAEYPIFLGAADFGVCLHKSSSGLDLPMKIVDMFGCGVPVCAITFKCISELVKHKENGFIFVDSKQLLQQMKDLLHKFPHSTSSILTFMRKNIEKFRDLKWHDNWTFNVRPMFTLPND